MENTTLNSAPKWLIEIDERYFEQRLIWVKYSPEERKAVRNELLNKIEQALIGDISQAMELKDLTFVADDGKIQTAFKITNLMPASMGKVGDIAYWPHSKKPESDQWFEKLREVNQREYRNKYYVKPNWEPSKVYITADIGFMNDLSVIIVMERRGKVIRVVEQKSYDLHRWDSEYKKQVFNEHLENMIEKYSQYSPKVFVA